jgi:hypothetical protein
MDAVEQQVQVYNERNLEELVASCTEAVPIYRIDGDGLIDKVR